MFKLKKILSLTAIFALMVSCNPKAQTPNPEVPNPEVPKPDPEVPNPEPDTPVPDLGRGPIFEVEGDLFDFSQIVDPIHTPETVIYFGMDYVPVRAFEQYQEEVLKPGIWQETAGRAIYLNEIAHKQSDSTESFDIGDPNEHRIFDFTNPQSPQVIGPNKTFEMRRKKSATHQSFERWHRQDMDIVHHNTQAKSGSQYRLLADEEFYVIVVAYIQAQDSPNYRVYLPININGLSHSTYMLE